AAAILLHGRGGNARDVLGLARTLEEPRLACLAPQAADSAWYPRSFLEPIDRNEPWLSSALAVVRRLLDGLAEAGIPARRTVLLGFSQGACLALEFAARNATRYGGVAGLAGGLIGAPGTPRDYAGSLEETPVFLGCGDRDPFVPLERLEETARVLAGLEADVTKRVYPGMGHIVNEDEIEHLRRMVSALTAGDPAGS
ncbi:MAG TPA: dienelactone hydrolase family protein, partial [Gemmatimonadota bacterium]|nr:dienelactone hydrolase family protein [Gemmatimonadota bacterium]